MGSASRVVDGVLLALGMTIFASTAGAADRKVIILQALTGNGAFVGVPAAEAMKFAADELNAKGFLGADKLTYEVVDSASTRAQAMASITRYAADPNVLAILGPTTAVEAIPGGAVATEGKVVMYAMTNAEATLKSGPYSFFAAQPPRVTMPHIADYVLNVVKARNCAIVNLSDNEAYVEQAKYFREYAEPRGLKIVDSTGVKGSDSDFSAVSTRIVGAKPDCVMLFTHAPVAANLAIQLKQAGLDARTRLIGQTGIASPQLVSIGGASVEGVVFNADWSPGGNSPAGKAFVEAYRKATGKEADNWAALGYTYMNVLATAIKNASPNPTRDKVRDAMTRTKDVPVIVGGGKYSLNDRVPDYGVTFLQVRNGQFVAAQ